MKNLYFLTTILFLCVFIACQSDISSKESSDQISLRLDKASFAEKMKTKPKAKLIDIRTPEEFQAGAIAGAVNIDFYDNNFDTKIQQLNKDAATLIYCQSGGRSGKALKKMRKMGFKEVYELKTGYSGWK